MSAGSLAAAIIGNNLGLTNAISLDGSTEYFSRTSGSPTSATIYTISCWVKRGGTGALMNLMGSGSATANQTDTPLVFNASDQIATSWQDGAVGLLNTTTTVTDTTTWHHLVCAVDTNQGTASNRVKVYLDGTQESLTGTQPTSGYSNSFNTNAFTHRVGNRLRASANSWFFNGQIAYFHFIDGQQLTPSSFAVNNRPIPYTGTYGNNGFLLSFLDATSVGNDLSSNSNDWTPTSLDSTDLILTSLP